MRSEVGEIHVGVLGRGPVAQEIRRMVDENSELIRRKVGRALKIRLANGASTDFVDDPEFSVVVELSDSDSQAVSNVERALRNGKHVVTANRKLIAEHGNHLIALAHGLKLDLHYEAAVGGGIPLIQPLKHQFAGNDILRLVGILNSSTNYILSLMHETGASFSEALACAEEFCYMEANPADDLDGIDARDKLAILASIAFDRNVPVSEIYCEGIRNIHQDDVRRADHLGYVIKLLAIAEQILPGNLSVRVHPTLVAKSHPLANVQGHYNALLVTGDFAGEVVFSGKGSGNEPVASAIVGDLVDIGRNIVARGLGSAIPYYTAPFNLFSIGQIRSAFYLRLVVEDRPPVLGELTRSLGNQGISIASMEMRALEKGQTEIVMVMHPCVEDEFQRALAASTAQEGVVAISSVYRLFDDGG